MREVQARLPLFPPPALDQDAAVRAVVDWALEFPGFTFEEKREALKRVIRRIPVVQGHIPEVLISGAFLADAAPTKSAQHLTPAHLRLPW